MKVTVIGAATVAAEFALMGATVRKRVGDASLASARGIADEWMQIIPQSPGGYQGAGFTSSPGANIALPLDDGPMVGAEAVNRSFVARFLQGGTAHHGPKVDLLGAADGHVDSWHGAVLNAAVPT